MTCHAFFQLSGPPFTWEYREVKGREISVPIEGEFFHYKKGNSFCLVEANSGGSLAWARSLSELRARCVGNVIRKNNGSPDISAAVEKAVAKYGGTPYFKSKNQ